MGPEQFSRQHVVDLLRRAGWSELADEASRTLPDPVDVKQLGVWGHAAWRFLQRFDQPVRQQYLSQEVRRALWGWPLAWPSPSGPDNARRSGPVL